MRTSRSVLLSLALVVPAARAEAVQRFSGQTEGGAFYTIEAPDGWTGADGLVIYNHGFDIGPVEPDPNLGVLSDFVLEQGFALAASSYRLNGWALFHTAEDNRALYRKVVELLGEPDRVVVFGGSLGALVTVQTVERGGVGNVVAAYPVCGPLAGSGVWHQALDLRLTYDLVCEGVSGGELPGGAEGLPFALDPEDFDGVLGEVTAAAIASAVASCTGIGIPEALRSDGQRDRMQRLLAAMGISEDFLGINMAYATAVLSDLVHDPEKLDRRRALGNAKVDYGDALINAGIARVSRDPFDHLYLKRFYTPTGRVGDTKLLITHTDKDDLVVVEHQQAYLERVPAGQVSAAVVVEEAPGHCAYTPAELVAGWNALLDWVDSDVKPGAQELQDRCQTLVGVGAYAGPCRYDPAYQVADIATRIRPRGEPETPVSGAMSGSFFVADQAGQGWFVEILADGRAVVYWFTYDRQGQPIWIGGTGEVLDNAIFIDDSWMTTGARFGPQFDPDDVELVPWGTLNLLFTTRGEGMIEYSGPEGFGAGRESLVQLTRIGDPQCGEPGPGLSGIWYDPDRIGEGMILEAQADGRIFGAWFTYDPQGRQLWLYGEADLIGAQEVGIALGRFRGPLFGPDFDPDDLVGEAWGRLTLQPQGGNAITASYASPLAGYGSGTLNLLRLTRPVAEPTCP